MTAAIREYDVVRVRSLDGMRLDTSGLGDRTPAVGDLGAVVSILSADDREDEYLVECVRKDATTAWFAAFPASSIEVASSIEAMSR
jgi:hypothetical protein